MGMNMKIDEWKEIINILFLKKIPKQLIIQMTDICNAKCPQCGMNVSNKYERRKLGIDSLKLIIDKATEIGVKALSITGGEPLLMKDELFEALDYASKNGIKYTRTGTNGFIFMSHKNPHFKKSISNLAESIIESKLYTFWISIDSWDSQKHEKNRGLNGVIEGIEKGLKIFENYGLSPSVNLGINRLIEYTEPYYLSDGYFIPEAFYENYYKGLSKFFDFVISLGFKIANLCYPMSFDGAVYKAESSEYIVNYSDQEKKILYKVIFDVVRKYRNKIKIFTPLVSIKNLIKEYENKKSMGCFGGDCFFFVDTTGKVYPCGFKEEKSFGDFLYFEDNIASKNDCKDCDWECFRDPSALFNPLVKLTNPLYLFNNINTYYYLLKDITYYAKSRFFSMQTIN
jgi:MoaA/NifB/PqqE/SkfB family radical SAM enzyme